MIILILLQKISKEIKIIIDYYKNGLFNLITLTCSITILIINNEQITNVLVQAPAIIIRRKVNEY